MTPRVLVVAKAPVAGRAKTRLGAVVGHERAADLAAAALLDTLEACRTAFDGPCYLALDGDLATGARATDLRDAVRGWQVFPQEGASFGARLAHAHQYVGGTVGGTAGGPVVQVGMDTPQLTPELLRDLADRLAATGAGADAAVLAPAEDGGWWALALARPDRASALTGVPMSTPTTGPDTAAALRDRGAVVVGGPLLRDVDTPDDAARVAAEAPTTRFARAWAAAEQVA